ncbi:MAG: lipopolysaccharide heptosyltransferase II [Caldimicrobium sp.]
MKLLIVKLSALGDVIQTLPALSYLKKVLPSAQIDWVVEEKNAQLLKEHPYLSRVILFNKSYLKHIYQLRKFLLELREVEYTAVIDFQGLLKSALITFFTKNLYSIGFSNSKEGSSLFYKVKFAPYDRELHAVKRYLLLAQKSYFFLLEGKEVQPKEIEIIREVPLSEERPFNFEAKKPYFILIPSARWKTKLWPPSYWENFIGLTKTLRKDFDFYFVGDKKEPFKSFAENLSEKYEGVYSFVGKTNLKELLYLIKRSEIVITVDTGPMHLASLLNKPIIALFGPTSPQRTGPWSEKYIVLKSNLPCQPCFKKNCAHTQCMYLLKPETLYTTLQDFLPKICKTTSSTF